MARDNSGNLTGRFGSYGIGLMGTAQQPQFSCEFSFCGFPAGGSGKYVIVFSDPPVWQAAAPVEDGITTPGTLSVVENFIFMRFINDPSGGCMNVEPFKQGSRSRLLEKQAWNQVRVIARDTRLLASPRGEVRPEPLLRRGELAPVLEERDGWLFAEIERVDPIPGDKSEQTGFAVSRLAARVGPLPHLTAECSPSFQMGAADGCRGLNSKSYAPIIGDSRLGTDHYAHPPRRDECSRRHLLSKRPQAQKMRSALSADVRIPD